jgi:hypothetical protein
MVDIRGWRYPTGCRRQCRLWISRERKNLDAVLPVGRDFDAIDTATVLKFASRTDGAALITLPSVSIPLYSERNGHSQQEITHVHNHEFYNPLTSLIALNGRCDSGRWIRTQIDT